jgi:hypothetical protein
MQGTGSTGLQHKRENTSRNTRVSNTEKHTDSNFGAQDSRGVGRKIKRNQANIMGKRLVRSKCYVPCKSKKNDPNHEGKQAYSDVLAGCTNFLSKKTCLMYLAERLGVEVDRSTKCHPETAGEGIEYSWAEQNQCIEGPSWQIRRERRTSTILSFDAYQVKKRMKRRLIKTDYMKVFPKSSSLYPGIF